MTHSMAAAGGASATSNETVTLDTNAYSSSTAPTYYFEIVADSTVSITFTVTLRRAGTSTDDATCTIPLLTTAFTRIRSASFSPPSGQTQYTVFIDATAGATKKVVAARIIVLQSELAITQTQTQIEIAGDSGTKTNTVAAAVTNPKYWLYTSANWTGAVYFSVEAVWKTSAKNTTTITLQEDNGSFASWTDKVTIVSAGTSSTGTTLTRVPFGFTPTTGRHYQISAVSSTSKSSYAIANAKIIVDQGFTDSQLVAPNTATLGTVQGGTATNQATGQSFTAGVSYSCASILLSMVKVGSPSDNLTLEVLTGSITGTVIATSSATSGSGLSTLQNTWLSFAFSSFSITSGTKYYLRLTRSGANDTNNYYIWIGTSSSVLSNGGGYKNNSGTWTSESATDDLAFQMVPTPLSPLANCEPQFLMENQPDIGTGLQTQQTIWNSSEWNAGSGTITYKHAMDSDNASNSIKLRDITAAADISSSTITGANQQVSGSLGTLTTAHELDTWVLDTTGVVAAGRMLVIYAYVAPTVTLPDINQQPLLAPYEQ